MRHDLPPRQGLYDPAQEHDACGVAFVVHMKGLRSHDIVKEGIGALCNLQHRGASGSEVNTGDGAGILLQIPDRFLREVVGFALPAEGSYATGIAFLPTDPAKADEAVDAVEKIAASEGLRVLGWRDLPFDDSMIGSTAAAVEPAFRQIFLAGDGLMHDEPRASGLHRAQADRARGGYAGRRRRRLLPEPVVSHPRLQGDAHHPSAGRVLPRPARRAGRIRPGPGPLPVLDQHLPVLAAGPPVPLHRPQRRDQHRAGQPQLDAGPRGPAGQRVAARRPGSHLPDLHPRGQRLGHLRRGARAAAPGRLRAAPRRVDDDPRGVGEPRSRCPSTSGPSTATTPRSWSPGTVPASIAFTDGTVIGAVLDRNGLRPSRYWVTYDDLVVMASEVGVLDVDPARVVHKGRLQPGRMFLVDTAKGRIVDDDEIKTPPGRRPPLRASGSTRHLVELDQLPYRPHELKPHATRPAATTGLRLHERGAPAAHRPDGPDRRRAHRLDGHRHALGRALVATPSCCSTTSHSCSPR